MLKSHQHDDRYEAKTSSITRTKLDNWDDHTTISHPGEDHANPDPYADVTAVIEKGTS